MNISQIREAFDLTVRACGWSSAMSMLVWKAYLICYISDEDFSYAECESENYAKADA